MKDGEDIHGIARRMAAMTDLPTDDTEESDYRWRWRGPPTPFHAWFMTQEADMQARVRRVFPSLKVEEWETAP